MTEASSFDLRFGGIERLLGAAALQKLRDSHVMVVGLGGVGSWVVEALARSGVGHLSLVDFDDICLSNTNRQLHTLESTIGKSKAHVLADRAKQISPEIRIDVYPQFFDLETGVQLLSHGPHLVVDCIDKLANKVYLLAQCIEMKLPVVTVGGAGGRRDLSQIKVADLSRSQKDGLLHLVRRELRRKYGFEKGGHSPFGIPCVYSEEPQLYPIGDGCVTTKPEKKPQQSMDCRLGFGAATWVTGTFGFLAAQLAIEELLSDSAPAS